MPTLDKINSSVKDAMRSRDKDRLKTLRLITSTVKQIEVDERIEVDEERLLTVLDKMVKQRRDALSQFESAGRQDLADIETAEITIIQEFMPEQLSDSEIDEMIKQAIAETGASSMKEMGKVMGIIRPKAQGRADMGQLSGKIKAQLS
ncbi:MAG: GatB/YqeY domain-containing protein [Gammaproteobacteria bacterium]|uniref:GatB/YqeY domain-containing protein n=1 Tax=Candidatus Thiopontia autotrophica TaxID=2841688 RepID=A0A8J6P844_9GAMM|nr:GatB/YqeY domain-containing protein [Candidatus Thiopontia autotrophica]MBL6968783.1 GatB/YqeY domain-containing protein [Gammaproteobacteria bacterium]